MRQSNKVPSSLEEQKHSHHSKSNKRSFHEMMDDNSDDSQSRANFSFRDHNPRVDKKH